MLEMLKMRQTAAGNAKMESTFQNLQRLKAFKQTKIAFFLQTIEF